MRPQRKHTYVTFSQMQKIGGFLFTLPFVVGFILFFAYPFIQAIILSFNELVLTSETFELQWRGLYNTAMPCRYIQSSLVYSQKCWLSWLRNCR